MNLAHWTYSCADTRPHKSMPNRFLTCLLHSFFPLSRKKCNFYPSDIGTQTHMQSHTPHSGRKKSTDSCNIRANTEIWSFIIWAVFFLVRTVCVCVCNTSRFFPSPCIFSTRRPHYAPLYLFPSRVYCRRTSQMDKINRIDWVLFVWTAYTYRPYTTSSVPHY